MFSNVTAKEAAEWSTALLVFVSSASAGHFAAQGMDAVQWLGAGVSVLGSVTLAVTVRLWPKTGAAQVSPED